VVLAPGSELEQRPVLELQVPKICAAGTDNHVACQHRLIKDRRSRSVDESGAVRVGARRSPIEMDPGSVRQNQIDIAVVGLISYQEHLVRMGCTNAKRS